jgi:ParB-like chromosome segregation protein Spo0J
MKGRRKSTAAAVADPVRPVSTHSDPDIITPAEPSPILVHDWPIDHVKPYPGNARQLSDRAIPALVRSIREFGWRQPIVVDEDGVIIVGHTRWLAAKLLELKWVPVHVARGLSPAKVAAYRLADNRTADNAEWDLVLLEKEIGELRDMEIDLALTGFTSAETDRTLTGNDYAHPEIQTPNKGGSSKTVECPGCGHVFDR